MYISAPQKGLLTRGSHAMQCPKCSPLQLVAALLLVGCAGDVTTADVALRTESDFYHAGDSVQVRLANHTDASVRYNICFAFLTLERRGEGGWEHVPVNLGPAPDAACTAQLNGLAPGEDAESTAYLPSDIEAGTYRLASSVEVSNVRRALQTNAFGVRSN